MRINIWFFFFKFCLWVCSCTCNYKYGRDKCSWFSAFVEFTSSYLITYLFCTIYICSLIIIDTVSYFLTCTMLYLFWVFVIRVTFSGLYFIVYNVWCVLVDLYPLYRSCPFKCFFLYSAHQWSHPLFVLTPRLRILFTSKENPTPFSKS